MSDDPHNVTQSPCTILGVDPGYERCGFAVIEKRGGERNTLLYSDCFMTSARDAFDMRLVEIGDELLRLFALYEPHVCALEKVYFTSNQKTAMRVSEVRGALLYLARRRGLTVVEYGPNEVKVAIAGDGRAEKRQVMAMVPRLIALTKEIRYDDEYDAIAIALTASATLRPLP